MTSLLILALAVTQPQRIPGPSDDPNAPGVVIYVTAADPLDRLELRAADTAVPWSWVLSETPYCGTWAWRVAAEGKMNYVCHVPGASSLAPMQTRVCPVAEPCMPWTPEVDVTVRATDCADPIPAPCWLLRRVAP